MSDSSLNEASLEVPDDSQAKQLAKKKGASFKVWIKLGITTLLVGLIYSRLSFTDILTRVANANLSLILFAIFLYTLGQVLSAYKWSLFLRSAGIKEKSGSILSAYLIGMFVNAFGLGTVGGDFARTFALNSTASRSEVFGTVISDRVHGLIILISVGVLALLYLAPPNVPSEITASLALIVLFVLCSWLFAPKLLLSALKGSNPLVIKIRELLSSFPKDSKVILYASLISAIFHSLQILMAIVIFNSIGSDLPTKVAFAAVPFINAASALPISVNGLGVREFVGIYLLGPVGVSKEAIVSFAGIWLLVVSLVSGVCGVLVAQTLNISFSSFYSRDRK